MTTTLRENLEIKARVLDVDGVLAAAKGLATEYGGVMRQRDTYFACESGRLKLREIEYEPMETVDKAVGDDHDRPHKSSQLIWYQRRNDEKTKSSRYRITDVTDPASLRSTLSDALGVREIVNKRREVFLHKNVRIHLDDVEQLGHFLELEAVQPADFNTADSMIASEFQRAVQLGLVDWLMDGLGVGREQLIAASYVDLISGEC